MPRRRSAHVVLVAKYAWHLPLYRQAQMLLAQGREIKRGVLAFWVAYAAACRRSRASPRAALRFWRDDRAARRVG
jgi:transposase